MRIAFVTYHLGAGGAERVLANMANHWARLGREVTVLTLAGAHESFFPLEPAVHVRYLGVAAASAQPLAAAANNLARLRSLRGAIVAAQPDAAIAFMTRASVLTVLATQGLKLPVYVEEHTDPAAAGDGRLWRGLRGLAYRRAAGVVVLSEEARAALPRAVQPRTRIIPNAIEVAPRTAPQPVPGAPRRVVALGRLDPVKGFDRLLEAFRSIADDFPGWELAIWGDGPERDELLARRDRLGLSGRVSLPGATKDPHGELRRADLFVMTSHREGFPMALGEALACGLPAVSFDCPSGPRQLIRQEIDGLLVPDGDVAALAAAMRRLMADEELRARFARRAPEVTERFGTSRIMEMWESMLGSDPASREVWAAAR
jgi:glycosyltransferase involved in cell wall biosynthesis